VHTDAQAAESTQAVAARAFTVGQHIVFGSGNYAPGDEAGRKLIAHELVHTIQQRSVSSPLSGEVRLLSPQDESEQEALQAERHGEVTTARLSPAIARKAAVQRAPEAPAVAEAIGGTVEQVLDKLLARTGEALSPTVQGYLALRDQLRQLSVITMDEADVVSLTAFYQRLRAQAPIWLPVPSITIAPPIPLVPPGPIAINPWVIIIILVLLIVLILLGYYLGDPEGEQIIDKIKEKIKPAPKDQPKAKPESVPEPEGEPEPQGKPKKVGPSPVPEPRQCRFEPCEHPLPISWPAELPLPPEVRSLIRTTRGEREWEGIDRGKEQEAMRREIREAHDRLIPPPQPCFTDDAEPNALYDAHHAHPLYLGGEDARYNLCAIEFHRHERGHRRLDNQAEHLEEYIECGICSPRLSQHPPGQAYEIVESK
jgi:hypothetical protein